jgi:polysaccharide export outer membrane protein
MNNFMNNVRYLIATLSVLLVAGCASGPPDDPRLYGTDIYQMQRAQVMEYMVGPADMLNVSVWNHADLNRSVTVRPDGNISLPLIGDMFVVGMTPMELTGAVEERLANFMTVVPGEVSVVVDEVHSYTVSVLGEVNQPGRFEFKSQASVLDALAEAGGLTDFASPSKILILRPYEGETEKIPFNYKRMVNSRNNDDRVLVFPGDTILVP